MVTSSVILYMVQDREPTKINLQIPKVWNPWKLNLVNIQSTVCKHKINSTFCLGIYNGYYKTRPIYHNTCVWQANQCPIKTSRRHLYVWQQCYTWFLTSGVLTTHAADPPPPPPPPPPTTHPTHQHPSIWMVSYPPPSPSQTYFTPRWSSSVYILPNPKSISQSSTYPWVLHPAQSGLPLKIETEYCYVTCRSYQPGRPPSLPPAISAWLSPVPAASYSTHVHIFQWHSCLRFSSSQAWLLIWMKPTWCKTERAAAVPEASIVYIA